MYNISIEASGSSPEVDFRYDGKLTIKGNSYWSGANRIYDELIKWSDELKVQQVELNLILGYIDANSSKRLYALLLALNNNVDIKKMTVQWFYEPDDESLLELGEIYAGMHPEIEFNFIELQLGIRKVDPVLNTEPTSLSGF